MPDSKQPKQGEPWTIRMPNGKQAVIQRVDEPRQGNRISSQLGRRWSLLDREGVRHLPLQPNDDEAWFTPIACGGGINLPGPQSRNPVTCPACIEARIADRNSRV